MRALRYLRGTENKPGWRESLLRYWITHLPRKQPGDAALRPNIAEAGELAAGCRLPAAGKMVVGQLAGTGTRNIMRMIHHDTVFGSGEASKRPFMIVGNKAFGPGVADAKDDALLIVDLLV